MQYIFGDCELLLVAAHLLTARADVIVSPATVALEHDAGLAAEIAQQAGDALLHDSEQLLREYGALESGMALYTGAGLLPYRAIIHTIAPRMGEGEEQRKLELAVSRTLQLCEMNEWRSVAFPAFTEGVTGLPASLCAQALYRAITRYWDARHETPLRQVSVYLEDKHYRVFCSTLGGEDTSRQDECVAAPPATREKIGYVDLSAEDQLAGDDEIDTWFR